MCASSTVGNMAAILPTAYNHNAILLDIGLVFVAAVVVVVAAAAAVAPPPTFCWCKLAILLYSGKHSIVRCRLSIEYCVFKNYSRLVSDCTSTLSYMRQSSEVRIL